VSFIRTRSSSTSKCYYCTHQHLYTAFRPFPYHQFVRTVFTGTYRHPAPWGEGREFTVSHGSRVMGQQIEIWLGQVGYLLQHPRVSTEFAKRSFSYLAPKIWSNIPLDIMLCSTLPTFKRHLKTYIAFYTSLPPFSSPSDCLRLRFSMFADSAWVTNVRIIIIYGRPM